MSKISFRNLKKAYANNKIVINDLNLEIQDGSFTVLVGPSGCGKTTLLRILAGLEDITFGDVYIEDENVTLNRAEDRDIAMVFQNYALYPHMTVEKNIEFGLKNAKIPKEKRKEIIEEVVKLVGLEEYLNVKPSNMSGGQRQRVALARAISKHPKVFLMDEPLSNLDAKLRTQMRSELILLHQKLKTTFVYVTHDQIEAMTMGDNIVVMNDGRIMQTGDPHDIYNNPKNVFVAQFIGNPGMNIIHIEDIYFGFRPNHPVISIDGEKCSGIVFEGKALTRELLGSEVIYCLDTCYGKIMVKSTDESFESSSNIKCSIASEYLYFFDRNQDRIYDEQLIKTLFKRVEMQNEKKAKI